MATTTKKTTKAKPKVEAPVIEEPIIIEEEVPAVEEIIIENEPITNDFVEEPVIEMPPVQKNERKLSPVEMVNDYLNARYSTTDIVKAFNIELGSEEKELDTFAFGKKLGVIHKGSAAGLITLVNCLLVRYGFTVENINEWNPEVLEKALPAKENVYGITVNANDIIMLIG